ncbi:MAG: VOC family protein [Pigmentiphaga sp.]
MIIVQAGEPAYHHVAFELAGEAELEESIRRLSASEVKIVREVNLPWKRSFFLQDPDGLQSEWYVTRSAARRLSDRQEVPIVYAV